MSQQPPPKDAKDQIEHLSQSTAQDLMNVAEQVSMLSLPEIEQVVDVVSRYVPAGNVPGLILSGFNRLKSGNPSGKDAKRDIGMLFRGINQMAVYAGFFMGPAAVIWGYQNLLKLGGRDPEAAFPDGTWQFYTEYALREDTARHTNETDGFDQAFRDHGLQLSEVDRITAWVMTAIHTLHHYPRLLENEWRERVYIRKMIDLNDSPDHQQKYGKLYQKWLGVLPYRRMADARGDEDYPAYRHRKFDEWLFEYVGQLSGTDKRRWLEAVQEAKTVSLNAYLQQMNIQGYLEPDAYSETRRILPVQELHIGLIYQERYYLIPVCKPGTTDASDVHTVRGYIAAILAYPSQEPPAELQALARVMRGRWPYLRANLAPPLVEELSMLRLCPIVLNVDPRDRSAPLAQVRQAERGIGDHALTIFDTRETFVFDQSHIYFDGAWGVALAEIMTNEALSWGAYLVNLSAATVGERPYSPRFRIDNNAAALISEQPTCGAETTAENRDVPIKRMVGLRRIFKQRSDLLALTVNDLLLLYRAIHAISYQTDPELTAALRALEQQPYTREAAASALSALRPHNNPPAILMPVDASKRNPRDRLYPMSFEVPLADLNLLSLHQQVMAALDAYEAGQSGDTFDRLQRTYLAALAGFGQVMDRAKEIANAGESASVGTIKLLAHMSPALQRLLDQVPGQFEVLNDIIKGREVFSNVGQVARSSTLRRFITAKDDNERKTLAWGVLTDSDGQMVVTLRDFRPHVGLLLQVGQHDLAQRITQHYLDSYAAGLGHYLNDLERITLKSRETRMARS